MKKLSKIILVQWYRLQAIEIPIVGNTAIVGKNGSGKSAVLDAIQTVMTGGNKNLLKLNRASNGKSERTLQEYVLGVMNDPDLPDVRIKPREKANCYLALNLFDEETSETTCVGMGIFASLADPAEKIEGYFICPGLVGTKDLFLEKSNDSKTVVLPWVRVKERLSVKCPRSLFYAGDSPGRFTADLYTILSENPGSPNNDKVVMRAFLAALTMEQISNTTDFIRKYMLEPDNLQIKELQSALKNYRDMKDKTESVARRVDELTRIEGHCDKVENGRVRKVQAEYICFCALIEQNEELADPLRDVLADLEEERELVASQSADLSKALESLISEHGARENEKKNSDLQLRRERLLFELNMTERAEESARGDISQLRRLIQNFDGLKGVPLSLPLKKSIDALFESLPSDEDMLGIASWPPDPTAADRLLASLVEEIGKALPAVEEQHVGVCIELNNVDQRLGSLSAMLKQLQQGKAPLQANTEGLVKYLKEYGIDAKPLCDLVDVSDEKWREAIESVFGNIREALIVIPEHARKTVALYREEGRFKYPGCHIVNTTQTERWSDKKQKGSLAEHLSTENEHARAFINRRLGNIICVETEKQLLQHDRAATADRMLSSGGTVTELKAIPPILGRKSRETLKVAYQKELQELAIAREAARRRKDSISTMKDYLDVFRRTRDGALSVAELVSQRDNARKEAAEKKALLAEMAGDERDKKLDEEIERLAGEITRTREAVAGLNAKALQIQTDSAQKENALRQIEVTLSSLSESLKERRSHPLLNPADAAEQLDSWRTQCGTSAALVAKAQETEAAAQRSIEHNERLVIKDYAEYFQRNSVEEGDSAQPENFEDYAATVRRKKKHLVQTTLAEYREKSARALVEAEDTFRAKFIGRLVGKLEMVRVQIDMLNRALEKQPFNNETYKFRQHNAPEFKHIIDFAKSFGNQAPAGVGGLFDPANDPSSPHHKALEDITTALQDIRAAERLQDYRNFLTFEIEINDQDGAPSASLDYRIKKGSGGENQTPFYIAVGASLAAAYRLRNDFGKVKGGLNLAVFDETFSKLSVEPCINCLDFLTNINLQLVMAAPDDKFFLMSEYMDETIFVARDGGSVEINVINIKPAMRALLRSDSPYRRSTGTSGILNEPDGEEESGGDGIPPKVFLSNEPEPETGVFT